MKLKQVFDLYQSIFMDEALTQAEIGYNNDEVPVGSVIVHNNHVISSNYNKMTVGCNPTAHAEILCIQEAATILRTTNLCDCDMYVTLEPCAMCAQAIAFSKIKRLYFGAYNRKFGAIENGVRLFYSTTCNHRPEIYGGIGEQKSMRLMKLFFTKKRKKI